MRDKKSKVWNRNWANKSQIIKIQCLFLGPGFALLEDDEVVSIMKIILAVDPFEKDPILPQYSDLSRWCQNPKVDVKPVYVISSAKVSEVLKEVDSIDAALPEYVKQFAPLEILIQPLVSRKKEIETVLQYAHEQEADMIALMSRGKYNLEKKILGSFAESLLHKSDLPILFLREDGSIEEPSDKVLFATDFSLASMQSFSLFLSHVKDQAPEVVLYNAIPLPHFVSAGPVYAHSLAVLPQGYWDEQKRSAEKAALSYLRLAESQGLKCRFVIENQVASVEGAIKDLIKREKIRLVGLVSVSSSFQRLVLGSVSQGILRDNIRPIWVCGPQCLESVIS